MVGRTIPKVKDKPRGRGKMPVKMPLATLNDNKRRMFEILHKFLVTQKFFEDMGLSTYNFTWKLNLDYGVKDSYATEHSDKVTSMTLEVPCVRKGELTYEDNDVWTVSICSPEHLFDDVNRNLDDLEAVALGVKEKRERYTEAVKRAKKLLPPEDIQTLGIKG